MFEALSDPSPSRLIENQRSAPVTKGAGSRFAGPRQYGHPAGRRTIPRRPALTTRGRRTEGVRMRAELGVPAMHQTATGRRRDGGKDERPFREPSPLILVAAPDDNGRGEAEGELHQACAASSKGPRPHRARHGDRPRTQRPRPLARAERKRCRGILSGLIRPPRLLH